MVDDFVVKYIGKEHARHLEQAILQSGYRLKSDCLGKKYIGITLNWDYTNREVHLSMLGYNAKGVKRLGHEAPVKGQDSPHEHTLPKYSAMV